MTADEPAPSPGSVVTFTIDLRNAGPEDATGVVVQDQLQRFRPAGFAVPQHLDIAVGVAAGQDRLAPNM